MPCLRACFIAVDAHPLPPLPPGPNTQETYLFARTLLDCATASPDGRGRALIIGGAIANFTDVAATFKGIIQAVKERVEEIKANKMRLYVRRGGPNYKQGLAAMAAMGRDTGIAVEAFGPEASMTGICKLAIEYVRSFDATNGAHTEA